MDSRLPAGGSLRKGEKKKIPLCGQVRDNTKVVRWVSVAVGNSLVEVPEKGMGSLLDRGDGDDQRMKENNVATEHKDVGIGGNVAEKEVDSHTAIGVSVVYGVLRTTLRERRAGRSHAQTRKEQSRRRERRKTCILEEGDETQCGAVRPERTEGKQKEEATERGHCTELRGGREGELRTKKPATFLEERGMRTGRERRSNYRR
ncbi:hypothetical protein NDU88_000004 [Pleurodeles waltl]|uniref:Uncharacterized protein n=1 Tax=Pleurodeles waltl TaxID=8319 RepID=A0AAV7S5P6_PLEWA|nr:hypothetical protein NDU88_000004 [Pleurodeles waltl]